MRRVALASRTRAIEGAGEHDAEAGSEEGWSVTPVDRILSAYRRSKCKRFGYFIWRSSFPWATAFISDAALADSAERFAEKCGRGEGNDPIT